MNRHQCFLLCALLLPALVAPAVAAPEASADPPRPALRLNLPQPLTADLGAETAPALSPDGRWLLYASTRSGRYDLWIRPASGGVPQPLTTHPAEDHSPAWSPKGSYVAFVSTRDDAEGDIFILKLSWRAGRARAAEAYTVAGGGGFQGFPSFSRDGRYLAYQEGWGAEARVMLRDLRRDRVHTLTGPGYQQPRFHPKDDRLLCVATGADGSAGSLALIHPGSLKDPAPRIEVIHAGPFPASLPCWSPDGAAFAVALIHRDRDGDGALTPLDGSGLFRFDYQPEDSAWSFRLLSLGDASETFPGWGGDGYLYHVCDRQGSPDLWRVREEARSAPR